MASPHLASSSWRREEMGIEIEAKLANRAKLPVISPVTCLVPLQIEGAGKVGLNHSHQVP